MHHTSSLYNTKREHLPITHSTSMNPIAKCCLLLPLFFLAFLLPEAHVISCHPDDLHALQDFAGNLNGGGVLLQATWFGAMCCNWEGVSCDAASGRVTALRLPKHGLAGAIPGTSLAGLVRLEELDIGSNNFHNISGVLTVLRGCQNLTTLILTNNFGGEELPGDGIIGGFKRLEVLALGDCALRGRVPEWLSQCKKMEVLDLSGNQLVGSIPSWIGELHHLCYLDLSNNLLVGEVPKNLALLKVLTTIGHSPGMVFTNMPLYVRHNRITLGRRLNEIPNVITGTNNVVRSGSNNVVCGNDNTIIFGDENTISGNENTVSGNNHVVSGSKHNVSGSMHGITGRSSFVYGTNNSVSGINHVVSGSNNVVFGSNNVVSGRNHIVSGDNKVISGG